MMAELAVFRVTDARNVGRLYAAADADEALAVAQATDTRARIVHPVEVSGDLAAFVASLDGPGPLQGIARSGGTVEWRVASGDRPDPATVRTAA